MLYLVLLIWSLLSMQLFANIGVNVCDQIFPEKVEIKVKEHQLENEERPNYSLELIKFLARMTIAPSTMVKIQHIKNNNISSEIKDHIKIAFLNPKETSLTPAEENAYRLFKRGQKKIKSELKELGLRKGLRRAKNHSECLSFMTSEPLIEIKLQQLQSLVESNQDLLKKLEESNTTKQIQAQEKFLIKENWQIIKGKNLNQIYSIIKSLKPNSVLFLSHSSQEGRLFDYDSNIFPASYFTSLKNYIHNLILFNCYPEKVNKFYKMSLVGKDINVFYPELEKGVSLFLKEATPVMALKSIKKISLLNLDKNSEPETCSFQNGQKTPSQFSLFLNNTYLGSLVDKMEFNCELLKENNTIEVYSTIKSNSDQKPNIVSIILNNNIQVNLEEFNSKTTNRHIVTKGSFSYKGALHESY